MALVNIEAPLEQEGTKSVVRAWLKRVGDIVAQDEPIVELETDKVAVEVPSPAVGVLKQILLDVNAEAPPGVALGVLETGAARSANAEAPQASQQARGPNGGAEENQRLSPLVRRMLAEHGVSADDVSGTGRDRRITQADVAAFVEARAAKPSRAPTAASGKIPHDSMRRAIAEHMVRSLATAPHVTAVFEADFTAITAHRKKHKDAYAKAGAPLTYSAYFIRAAAEAMKAAPQVNSRWREDHVEIIEDVNIGMGVALGDKGLIAPVIMRAQALSLMDTARKLNELTEKARAGKLAPGEVQNGTFTISNHGVSGSLLAAPIIINQPQSAILGVGKLEKRVVVREVAGADAIAIRPMAYVSLSIDHRVLDGHQTNAWLARFVDVLETWPEEAR